MQRRRFKFLKTLFFSLAGSITAISIIGCGSVSGEISDLAGGSFSIQGQFKGLTYNSSALSVGSQVCADYTAKLYMVTENGIKGTRALAESKIDSNGAYVFENVMKLGIDSSSPDTLKNYIAVIEGCGESYQKVLTAFTEQNVSAATDVLSLAYEILFKNSRVVSNVLASNLKTIDAKLASESHRNRYNSFISLKSDSFVRGEFLKAFGFSIDELGYVAPAVTLPIIANSINEGATLAIDISKTHWNLDYVPEVQWLLDSTVISTAEDLSYSLGKNSQGTRTLRLRVGKQQAVGLLDVQHPIYEKEWPISVANSFPAVAPTLTLLGGTITNSQNVNLSISTGASNVNCETFSEMIITEDSVMAPLNWSGSFACSAQPTQSSTFTVSPGGGVKTVALWARDSAGNISPTPSSVVIVLDQTPPTVILNNLNGGQTIAGTGVYNILYTASDANLSSAPISIYVSSNSGTTYTQVASSINNTGTYSWSVPTVNSSTYRVRVVATDQAGNQTIVSSAGDFTVSTSAPNVTQTLIAADYVSNAASLSVTYGGSCELGLNVAILLDATPLTTVSCPAGTWTYTTTALVADGQRQYEFSQNNGVTASVSAVLKRDTVIPAVSSLLVAEGTASTSSRFLSLRFSANDTTGTIQSKVTHICAKTYQSSSAAPAAPTTLNDTCWIDLQTSGISTSSTLSNVFLANYFFNAFVTDNHNVRAWVRDEAGNISSTYAEDGLLFNLPLAGVMSNATAANIDGAVFPPLRSEISVASAQSVFIKWKATAGSSAFDQNSIRIFYNTTNYETTANWIEIDSGVIKSNAASAGCTVNATYFSGCYVWTNTVGVVAMRFKIQITDATGTTSSVETNRINTGNYNVLVGDLSVGIGGTASQYTFSAPANNSKGLAVTDDGIVYTITPGVGLVRIKPTTGLVELLVPETGADVDGIIGTATMSTGGGSQWLQIDGQNRVYFSRTYTGIIWTGNSPIRRFNPDTNTVEMIINTYTAGTTRASGVAGNIFKPGNLGGNYAFSPYVAPNGDVYFADALTNTNMVNVGFWKYTASTGLVTAIVMPSWTNIMGYTQNANAWVSGEDLLNNYKINGPVWVFNSDSSVKNFYIFASNQNTSLPGIVAAFDGNYQNLAQSQAHNFGGFLRSILVGRNGKLYRTDSAWVLHEVSETSATAGPVALFNFNSPIRDDGALASTSTSAGNYEITTSGRVYFIQNGLVRFIDEAGAIRTYMGKTLVSADGIYSRNARILGAGGIYKSNSGFIFTDYSDRILEHRYSDENLIVRAGNGKSKYTDPSLNAKSTGLYVVPAGGKILPHLAYDSSTDSIYTRSDILPTPASTTGRAGVLRISTTGVITPIVGYFFEDPTGSYPIVPDGSLGVNITTSGNLDGASLDVTPVVYDFNTNKLLMAFKSHKNSPTQSRNTMLKYYDTADAKVYSYAGINSGSSAPYTLGLDVTDFSADGSTISASAVPTYVNTFSAPIYDDANPAGNGGPRFVLTVKGTGRMVGLSVDNTQAIQPIANVGTYNFLTYVRKTGGNFVYKCTTGTGLLQKAQVVTESSAAITFSTITLPTGVTCSGITATNAGSLYFDTARNSIIFPITQNGFYGIAEYYDP